MFGVGGWFKLAQKRDRKLCLFWWQNDPELLLVRNNH